MRPPGYEPGELPTAPLRDVSRFVGAKVLLFREPTKLFVVFFFIMKNDDISRCVIRIITNVLLSYSCEKRARRRL